MLLICLLLTLLGQSQVTPCPQGYSLTTRKLNIKIDSVFNNPLKTDTSNNQNPTSVTTFGQYTFYVNTEKLTDGNVYMMVRTFNHSNNVVVIDTVFKIKLPISDGQYHVCPTIGVDSLGYIFITGDMHNDYWTFYRSKKPLDIVSGFDDISAQLNALAVGITYPTIFYDNNRGMYILFRHRRKNGKGDLNHRIGIIRYIAQNKSFIILGGTSYTEKNLQSNLNTITMGWANGFGGHYDASIGGGWYIKPGHRIYFDGKNRMHFITTVIGRDLGDYTGDLKYNIDSLIGGFESNTHILYAYSDDFGATWYQAGGTKITSLPLTQTNASIALNRYNEHDIIGGECELGAFNTNTPVISYKLYSDTSYHAIKWNNTSKAWEEICVPPKGTNIFMCRNVMDSGYVAWYNGYTFAYSNNGINWIISNAQTEGISAFPRGLKDISATGLDREYFKQTGNFRYQGTYNTYTLSNIYTLYTSVGDTNRMSTGVILPLKFVALDVTFTGGANNVSWTTSNEIDVAKYVVESSANGSNFIEKGTVDARGNGSYVFADRKLTEAANYYRIKAVDKTGIISYSAIVKMHTANTLQSVAIYPNPLSDNTANLVIHLPNVTIGQTYQIQVFNSLGQIVYSNSLMPTNAGYLEHTVNSKVFSKGTYSVNVSSKGQSVCTKKLLVQ